MSAYVCSSLVRNGLQKIQDSDIIVDKAFCISDMS